MKNFKKVISAVIALAMVISSFTAVSASKFADVADTANYAEAVEVLAALGIVNGTEENGTLVFKPENQVTRAEAATMIVGALNMSEDAQASAGTSQFADVNEQAAWASGYVNVGVAQGFIKGYDASTFGPLDNVTYAQLCVMLTSIAGYGDYAADNGGWPTGYTTMAASLGMSKGVSASFDTALTKGQVAIMIYNALQSPMLGVAEFSAIGNTFKMLDGKNNTEFKTVFVDKFGGYVATVTINNTPAADNTLDSDMVEFRVEKADWWPGFGEVKASGTKPATQKTYFKDVDVNNSNLQTGTAVFVENEDDELVMVYFASNSKSNTSTYEAADYVEQADIGSTNRYSAAKKQIRFGSKYVKLGKAADEIEVYVNGVLDTSLNAVDGQGNPDMTALDVAAFEAKFAGAQGTVTVIEREGAAGTAQNPVDSYAIMFDYYAIAEVVDVDYRTGRTEISLMGSKFQTNLDKIVIDDEDVEEGDVVVTVKKNGEAAELDSLVKGDIIAVKADFNNITNYVLNVDGEIDIIATNDTVSGVISNVDTEEDTYTIDGNVYSLVTGSVNSNKIKTSVDVTLDPFGRIYDTDENAAAAKFAIVLDVERDSTGAAEEVKLLLADGSTKSYELETAAAATLNGALATVESAAIQNRVVTYTVKNATGNVATITASTPTGLNGEYKSKGNMLGSTKITDATVIIDAQKAVASQNAADLKRMGNYAVYGQDSLTADVPYVGYTYKAVAANNYVSFVVLTQIDAMFGESARFAIVQKAAVPHYTEDEDLVDLVKVLYEGQSEQELLFNSGVYANAGLEAGDAFFFETDSYGFVSAVYPIYSILSNGVLTTSAPVTLAQAGIAANKLPQQAGEAWNYSLVDGRESLKLVHGVVVEVESDAITFAEYNTTLTLIDTTVEYNGSNNGVVTYSVADDCAVYAYDAASDEPKAENKFRAKAAGSVKASKIAKYDANEDGKYNANEYVVGGQAATNMFADANEAIAIVVDGEIVEMYVVEK